MALALTERALGVGVACPRTRDPWNSPGDSHVQIVKKLQYFAQQENLQEQT